MIVVGASPEVTFQRFANSCRRSRSWLVAPASSTQAKFSFGPSVKMKSLSSFVSSRLAATLAVTSENMQRVACPPTAVFTSQVPEGKLNLRAYNLIVFSELARGVDDETWLYHLREGGYSGWFRDFIKDRRARF